MTADERQNEPPRLPAQTGSQRAEAAARKRGYHGQWPPPPRPRIENAEQLQAVLDRLEANELTAHLVSAAGDHIMEFFAAVPPKEFLALGEKLVQIVLFEEVLEAGERMTIADPPAARVRIRAVQAALKPMLQVIQMVPQLTRLAGDPSPMLSRLLESVYAFLGAFGGQRMGRLAGKLLSLANESESADTAVRAAGAAADLALRAMSGIVSAKLGIERAEKPVDQAALDQAAAELRHFDAEIVRSRRPQATPTAEVSE